MLLYRAINDREYQNVIINNKGITSLDGISVNKAKELYGYYNYSNKQYAYNFILNHVEGSWVKTKTVSPWISMSRDFRYTVENYSIIKSNNTDLFDNRRSIVVVNADNIARSKKEIFEASMKSPFIIDLSENNVSYLTKSGTIGLQEYSKTYPDYRLNNHTYRFLQRKPGALKTYSDKATMASEALVYMKIEKCDMDAVLYPILIDLLYSYSIDLNNNYDVFKHNLNKAYERLASLYIILPPMYLELYPDVFSGSDLTTYLVNHYEEINGSTIEEKYEAVKEQKRVLLQKIASYLFPKQLFLKPSRLIDDNIYVFSYNNLVSLMEETKNRRDKYAIFNNIPLIERDGLIYKYNSELDLYENAKGYVDKRYIRRK